MTLSILLLILHLLDIGLPVLISGVYFRKTFDFKHSETFFYLFNVLGMLLIAVLPRFSDFILLRLCIFFGVFFIANQIFLEGSIWKKLYHVMQFTFSYIICEFGYALTVENFQSRYNVTSVHAAIHETLLYLVFSLAVLLYFEIQLHFFLKKSLEITTALYQSMTPMLLIFLALLMVSYKMSNYEFNMILLFCLILMNLAILYLYRVLMNASQKLAEEKLKFQEHDYFQQKLKDEKTLSTLRHDMKNMLLSVQADIMLEDYKCASQKIDKITRKISSANHSISGVQTIDVILSPKIDYMYQEQISFSTEFSIKDEKPLKNHSLDLAIILGNLMDNAIEGTMRLDLPDESMSRLVETRYIDLKIKQDANMLTILIANSSHPVHIASGGPQLSEKSTGRIGIGIETIRERVSALNGYCSFKSLDNRFQVIVQLPL